MKLADFKVEQWMNDHEMQAKYNLTDTCSKEMSLKELLDLESIDLDMILDYGEITGSQAAKKGILSLYESGNYKQITTCHGCLEANMLVMQTLLEKGDHVITFSPGYQQFMEIPASLGCEVSILPLDAHWQPSLEAVKDALCANTKMVILNNPNNPTGISFSKAFVQGLIDLCKARKIYILCDEVYRGFSDDKSISDMYEWGISTSSLSKTLSLAGLRYGWIKADESIIHQINVRRDYAMISTGPLMDALATIALRHKTELMAANKARIETNKQTVREWLKDHPHFEAQLPEAATVSFLHFDYPISSVEFAEDCLAETGVFFVPGSCFGYESYLRLGLGQDSEKMKEGLAQLSLWCEKRFG